MLAIKGWFPKITSSETQPWRAVLDRCVHGDKMIIAWFHYWVFVISVRLWWFLHTNKTLLSICSMKQPLVMQHGEKSTRLECRALWLFSPHLNYVIHRHGNWRVWDKMGGDPSRERGKGKRRLTEEIESSWWWGETWQVKCFFTAVHSLQLDQLV